MRDGGFVFSCVCISILLVHVWVRRNWSRGQITGGVVWKMVIRSDERIWKWSSRAKRRSTVRGGKSGGEKTIEECPLCDCPGGEFRAGGQMCKTNRFHTTAATDDRDRLRTRKDHPNGTNTIEVSLVNLLALPDSSLRSHFAQLGMKGIHKASLTSATTGTLAHQLHHSSAKSH